ncbi:lipoprotein [Spiroplasma eriocheiris]|uniref:Lipoprotein n=1 Tax=Spiroplasma eriocheiris TaxID=315358 RepID=A0A0H3XLU9_9MOLU|nr:lipoprotein [Spiroplasma eriocheiris]AHF58116.1 hypothetical protein SPE_0999 [Spiroplasma eriocheiris CCTCC M 207170]AKM54554.1 hypothetical protein SERIO_v1c09960 [Spiroplasma eriocheiris]
MKRLLALFSALTLTATTTSSIIACNEKSSAVDLTSYTQAMFEQKINSQHPTDKFSVVSFNNLVDFLWNVISNNKLNKKIRDEKWVETLFYSSNKGTTDYENLLDKPSILKNIDNGISFYTKLRVNSDKAHLLSDLVTGETPFLQITPSVKAIDLANTTVSLSDTLFYGQVYDDTKIASLVTSVQQQLVPMINELGQTYPPEFTIKLYRDQEHHHELTAQDLTLAAKQLGDNTTIYVSASYTGTNQKYLKTSTGNFELKLTTVAPTVN